jgi:hypothetical protein
MNRPGELITTLDIELGPVWEVGELPGGFRRVISIVGGTMVGPVLSGEILPGGADWNTQRADGTSELWARYTVRTDDGVCIGVINAGTIGPDFVDGDVVTVPQLEAPAGPYAWLADVALVGTLRPIPGREAVQIGIHRAAEA